MIARLPSPAAAVPLPDPDRAAPPDLAGRVVLVTGATGGIGAPLARACAARGATVVLHARAVAPLEKLYDEIVEAGDPEPVILPLDLAKAEAADFGNVAAALEAQFQRLDGLVHTAAMLARSARSSTNPTMRGSRCCA
jgi:NAD(P)-dependent dehydrogenase (short-subunit alcohol dehydrogenase family)